MFTFCDVDISWHSLSLTSTFHAIELLRHWRFVTLTFCDVDVLWRFVMLTFRDVSLAVCQLCGPVRRSRSVYDADGASVCLPAAAADPAGYVSTPHPLPTVTPLPPNPPIVPYAPLPSSIKNPHFFKGISTNSGSLRFPVIKLLNI